MTNTIPLVTSSNGAAAETHTSDAHNGASGASLREQQPAATSVETAFVLTPDPMVKILAAFDALPAEYHADLFADFRCAAEARNLRQLLDTISDWAATAELYADKRLAQEVQQAIENRSGVAA